MVSVFITILFLERDTMTKATHKRKHLIGALLVVSEGESIVITAGNMGAHMAPEK